MGPARLRPLLDLWPAEEAWARAVRGDVPAVGDHLRDVWRSAAARLAPDHLLAAHRERGVEVLCASDDAFPVALRDDPEPPAVLFVRGDLGVLGEVGARRRVAIVGTRRCTWSGRTVARSLGSDLAAAGVSVVSGLALGIDGEAHTGALEVDGRGGAPPIGVVGTGLDVVYPTRHAALWDRVATAGALVSEYPLGTTAERWRFPARNRIIAALAEVVVVVESAARGGSMHTVDAALERDRPVLAVPGSVRSPASAGTNGLLAAGCPPCRDVDDVLVALGLTAGSAAGRGARGEFGGGVAEVDARAPHPPLPDDADAVAVLDALGWEPATLDELAERLGVPLGPLAVHLTRLANAGWVIQRAGWWERTR